MTQHAYFPFTIKLASEDKLTWKLSELAASHKYMTYNTGWSCAERFRAWSNAVNVATTGLIRPRDNALRFGHGGGGQSRGFCGAVIYSKGDDLLRARIQGSVCPSLASIWHECEQHVSLPHERCPSFLSLSLSVPPPFSPTCAANSCGNITGC